MTLRSSDLQSDGDLDSIRNSCDVYKLKQTNHKKNLYAPTFVLLTKKISFSQGNKSRRTTQTSYFEEVNGEIFLEKHVYLFFFLKTLQPLDFEGV